MSVAVLPEIAEAESPAGPLVAQLKGLVVSLERRGVRSEILHGVDLDIAKGEILGVVGQSGSGKSVLATTLLGLLPASSKPIIEGAALVGEVDMAHASEAVRRQVRREHLGAVFQNPMTSLNPTMRVGKQVAEAAWTKDAEEAITLMNRVAIPQPAERLSSFPHQLSGGLRQRVMVAMAIADNPDLIIADEPTTALDTTVQAQVLATLKGMRDTIGCSIILITHDLGVAAQVADRIAVIYSGSIVELGTSRQVLEEPQHEYTKGLLASRLTLTTKKPPSRAPKPVAEVDTTGMSAKAAQKALEQARAKLRRPIVEMVDLTCTFKVKGPAGRLVDLNALRGVTTRVYDGQSMAIVGESGSGKSTLLRAVAGLETKIGGDLIKPAQAEIQMVFQDAGASLTPWLRTESILRERLRGIGREQQDRMIAETLERVGLPQEIMHARPKEMSGGQCQRVALARATIIPPKVLLCDEPTSALDVTLAGIILNLIRDLQSELNMTVMFVTHDLAVARFVADRIAVMYLGRLVEVGPVEEVTRNPRHPYTRALLEAVPGAGIKLATVRGEAPSPVNPPTGCAYHPRCVFARPECAAGDIGTVLARVSDEQHGPLVHEVACPHYADLKPMEVVK
ncbi:MAG: ABC transporter ATP-binding protein [Propionibacteriaceae bacterium]|jgi:peptide/nickel transport system ATP-binding protein|nr:ABC transporter ATP-binding protein [Propionibacteriaceae bacterium]